MSDDFDDEFGDAVDVLPITRPSGSRLHMHDEEEEEDAPLELNLHFPSYTNRYKGVSHSFYETQEDVADQQMEEFSSETDPHDGAYDQLQAQMIHRSCLPLQHEDVPIAATPPPPSQAPSAAPVIIEDVMEDEEDPDRQTEQQRLRWMKRQIPGMNTTQAPVEWNGIGEPEASNSSLRRSRHAMEVEGGGDITDPQWQKKFNRTVNNKANNTLHRLRAEKGIALQKIGFSRVTSLGMLRKSNHPLRLDGPREPQLSSLRMGNGDLSRDEKCLTCKAYREMDDPACFGHLTCICTLLPIVQECYLSEYESLAKSVCQNCSSSLIRTGVRSRRIDELRGMDPATPVPILPYARKYFQIAGLELPQEGSEWMATTKEQVMSWKPLVVQAMRDLNARQVEFKLAGEYPDLPAKWPLPAKERYNRAFQAFQLAAREVEVWKQRLLVLPCNWIAAYNEHEEFGYHLLNEKLRLEKFNSDLQQCAAQGLLTPEQEPPAKRESKMFLAALQFLNQDEAAWAHRDRAMRALLHYLDGYIQSKNAEADELYASHVEKPHPPVSEWKICQEEGAEHWTVKASGTFLSEWQKTQFHRRNQLYHKNQKKERMARIQHEVALAALTAAEREAAKEAEDKLRMEAEIEERRRLQRLQQTGKKTYIKKGPKPKHRSVAAVAAAAAASAAKAAAEEEDMVKLDGGQEDFPCLLNEVYGERPVHTVEEDFKSPRGHMYCALSLGGCGSDQTVWCTRRLFFWSHYTSDCEMWYRLQYPFSRDEQLVSSDYVMGVFRRMASHPYGLGLKLTDVRNWKYNLEFTRPDSMAVKNLAVVPYPYRKMPAALMQAGKVAKHHLTTTYLSIMATAHDQYLRFMDHLKTLSYVELNAEDVRSDWAFTSVEEKEAVKAAKSKAKHKKNSGVGRGRGRGRARGDSPAIAESSVSPSGRANVDAPTPSRSPARTTTALAALPASSSLGGGGIRGGICKSPHTPKPMGIYKSPQPNMDNQSSLGVGGVGGLTPQPWVPDPAIEVMYWIQVHHRGLEFAHQNGEPWPEYFKDQREAMLAGTMSPFWVARMNSGGRIPWNDWTMFCLHPNFLFFSAGSLWNVFTVRAIQSSDAFLILTKQTTLQQKMFELVNIPKQNLFTISSELSDRFMGVMPSREISSDVKRRYAEGLPPGDFGRTPFVDPMKEVEARAHEWGVDIPPPPPKKRGRKTNEEMKVEKDWKQQYLLALRAHFAARNQAEQQAARAWLESSGVKLVGVDTEVDWELEQWMAFRQQRQKVLKVRRHCKQFYLTEEAREILSVEFATIAALRAQSGRTEKSNSTHREFESLVQRNAVAVASNLRGRGFQGGGGGGGLGVGQSQLNGSALLKSGSKPNRAAKAQHQAKMKSTKTVRNMITDDKGLLEEANKRAVKDSIRTPSMSDASLDITEIGVGINVLRESQERVVVIAANIDACRRLMVSSNQRRNQHVLRQLRKHSAAAIRNEWVWQAMQDNPAAQHSADARMFQAAYDGYGYHVAEADRALLRQRGGGTESRGVGAEAPTPTPRLPYTRAVAHKRKWEKKVEEEIWQEDWDLSINTLYDECEEQDAQYGDIYPAALELVKTSQAEAKSIDLKWFFRQGRLTPELFGVDKLQIGDTLIRYRQEGDTFLLNRQPSLHIYAIMKLIIKARPGSAIYLNVRLWSVYNGDNDGDTGTIVADNFNRALLESYLLMSPAMHLTNIKDGSALYQLVQDASLGIAALLTRPFRLGLAALQDMLVYYRRQMRWLTAREPTTPGRVYQTGDFTPMFVTRVRQLFMSKIRALWAQKVTTRKACPTEEVWWKTTDPTLVRILHSEELFLTGTEVVMAALPPTLHYIRYVDDDSAKPIRIEIRGGTLRCGFPIKSDFNGHALSLPNHLLYCFGPAAVIEASSNHNNAALYINTISGFSLGEYDSMLTYKTHVHLWKQRPIWRAAEEIQHKQWSEEMVISRQRLDSLLPTCPPALIAPHSSATLADLRSNALPHWTPSLLRDMPSSEAYPEPEYAGAVRCIPIASSLHQHDFTHFLRAGADWVQGAKLKEALMVFEWYRNRTKMADEWLKKESAHRTSKYHGLEWNECPFPPGSNMWSQGKYGSKGTDANWFNLCYQVGLPVVDGKLEKHDFGGRILLYLQPDGHWMLHYGMVESSLMYGMEPEEMFLPIPLAQKSNYESSGAVHETGYAAKTSSRWSSDRVVDEHRGVRDHNGHMVQTFYSSDNLNPAYARKVECLMDKTFVAQKAILTRAACSAWEIHFHKWMGTQPDVAELLPYAPYLTPLFALREDGSSSVITAPAVLSTRPSPTEYKIDRERVRTAQAEYVLLLRAFHQRQTAWKKCLLRPNLIQHGEIGCVDIPMLCRQIVADREGGGICGGIYKSPQTPKLTTPHLDPISPLDLFEQLTFIRQTLYRDCPLWQLDGVPFSAYSPGTQPLDWYLIENLTYRRIVGFYHMTRDEVVLLIQWIYDHWITSRVAIGEAVSILAVQSVYIDQTQGVLNRKHGLTSAMSELTRGPPRWNQLNESSNSIFRDHLLILELETWSDPKIRKDIRDQTGYELPEHEDALSFFKEQPIQRFAPTFTVETMSLSLQKKLREGTAWIQNRFDPRLPVDQLVVSEEERALYMNTCSSVIRQTFPRSLGTATPFTKRQKSSSATEEPVLSTPLYVTFGGPTLRPLQPQEWNPFLEFPTWYVRIVIDESVCTEMQMDWRAWVKQTRKLLSNCFWLYTYYYPSEQKAVVHIFKVQLYGEILSAYFLAKQRSQTYQVQSSVDTITQRPIPVTRPIVLWNDKTLDKKAAEAATVARTSSKRPRPASTSEDGASTSFPTIYMYESEPLCMMMYVKSIFTRVQPTLYVKMLDREAATLATPYEREEDMDLTGTSVAGREIDGAHAPSQLHKLTLNLHHKKSMEVLGAWYEFLLRPDVRPETASLIHPLHVCQIGGVVPARNVLVLEFMKVLADAGSSCSVRHILQLADSLTCGGSLVGLRSNAIEQLNDDLMTQVGYRSGFRQLVESGRHSRTANCRAHETRRFIARSFHSGTEIFSDTADAGGLVQTEDAVLPQPQEDM